MKSFGLHVEDFTSSKVQIRARVIKLRAIHSILSKCKSTQIGPASNLVPSAHVPLTSGRERRPLGENVPGLFFVGWKSEHKQLNRKSEVLKIWRTWWRETHQQMSSSFPVSGLEHKISYRARSLSRIQKWTKARGSPPAIEQRVTNCGKRGLTAEYPAIRGSS